MNNKNNELTFKLQPNFFFFKFNCKGCDTKRHIIIYYCFFLYSNNITINNITINKITNIITTINNITINNIITTIPYSKEFIYKYHVQKNDNVRDEIVIISHYYNEINYN